MYGKFLWQHQIDAKTEFLFQRSPQKILATKELAESGNHQVCPD